MPKPLRQSVLITAMVTALCAVVVTAFSWRPFLARWFYGQLRGDATIACDAFGTELNGWRADAVRRYLETEEGSRLFCETLLRELQRNDSATFGSTVVFLGITDGRLHVLGFVEGRSGAWAASPRAFGKEDRLPRLFSNAALLEGERSITDAANNIVCTVNASTDPLIPEFIRADMRRWHVVQVRRAKPGGTGPQWSASEVAFHWFKRAMEATKEKEEN